MKPEAPFGSAAVRNAADDTLDLIDIALIVVRRWRAALAGALLAAAAGGAVLMSQQQAHDHRLVIDVGRFDKGEPITSLPALSADLQNLRLPAQLQSGDFSGARLEDFARSLSFATPGNERLLVISGVAAAGQREAAQRLLSRLGEAVAASHRELLEAQRARLTERIRLAEAAVRQAEASVAELTTAAAGDEVGLLTATRLESARARYQEALETLLAGRERLDELRATVVQGPVTESRSAGPGLAATLVVTVLMGLFLAFFCALGAEFIARARRRWRLQQGI